MFKKLIELIKQAIEGMVKSKSVDSPDLMYSISSEMQEAIDLWKSMYKDKAPWIDALNGIYSLNIAKTICRELTSQVLSESKISVGTDPEDVESNTMQSFLNSMMQKHIIPKLYQQIEKAMALGGVVIKPYISNGHLYYDFTMQGKFYPLAFDDDDNITDIAFIDQFISEGKIYTKVERQTFDEVKKIVTVTNKAYVVPLRNTTDDRLELGDEIVLANVNKWAGIAPEITIENVERPLFGYYKVPNANNIDLECPLGVSVFDPAIQLIERSDRQFSRLDWEYEGGQLAIDVDATALRPSSSTYYGYAPQMDATVNRLYRSIDLNSDETYNAFAPALRDANYISGLNMYLTKIEDECGLARGTLSTEGITEAKTATEIRILKQRTYVTITSNQKAIEQALDDVMYASYVYAALYNLAPVGDYELICEWSDSVLVDVDAELEKKIQLSQEGIISKAEVRSWYTGEDVDTAQEMIDQIKEESDSGLDDIFTMGKNSNPTLENAGTEEQPEAEGTEE